MTHEQLFKSHCEDNKTHSTAELIIEAQATAEACNYDGKIHAATARIAAAALFEIARRASMEEQLLAGPLLP